MQSAYVRTDKVNEVVDNACQCAAFCRELDARPLAWKWVAISGSMMVQSACVLALTDAATSNAYIVGDIETYLNGRKRDQDLAAFGTLVERVSTKPVVTSPVGGQTAERVTLLHTRIRNPFQHFRSDGWSFEVSGLPDCVLATCDLVQHLVLDHPGPTIRLSREQSDLLATSISSIRDHMERRSSEDIAPA